MDLDDPRNLYWIYWYGYKPGSGQEALAFIKKSAIKWNQQIEPKLWSEKTLRKISR